MRADAALVRRSRDLVAAVARLDRGSDAERAQVADGGLGADIAGQRPLAQRRQRLRAGRVAERGLADVGDLRDQRRTQPLGKVPARAGPCADASPSPDASPSASPAARPVSARMTPPRSPC